MFSNLQCSVISITMFLLTINIIKKIPKLTKHLLFSDDSHIYCNGQNIKTTVKILQQALNILKNWSNKTGFNFSPGKSQCICFHTLMIGNHKLLLKDSKIPLCKSLHILGKIFDNELKLTHRLKKIESFCKIKINIMKTLPHYTWGEGGWHRIPSKLNIYESLILLQINYGSIVYSTTKENLLKILNPIHNEKIHIPIQNQPHW